MIVINHQTAKTEITASDSRDGNEIVPKGIFAAGAAPRHHTNSFETCWNPSLRSKHARTFPRGMILFAETRTRLEKRGQGRDQKVFGSLETPDRLVIHDSGCIRKSRNS